MNETVRYSKKNRATPRAIAACALAVTILGVSLSEARADLFVSGGTAATSTLFRITDAGVVSVFATNTSTSGALVSPRGLAVGADGFLYVANNGASNILRFNTTDASVSTFATFATPNALAFDSANNLYVTNPSSSTTSVRRFNTSGVVDSGFTVAFAGARGVAVDAAGLVYVSSSTSLDVRRFDAATGAPLGAFATSNTTGPREIRFDAAGNLYVLNNASPSTVTRYDTTGAQIGATPFATSGISNPQGMVFDPSGNLYVANNTGGLIRKFDSAGTSLGNANATTLSPTGFGIAYAPAAVAVPEPGTFALLAVGLTTLGGGLYKRRRRGATA